jgi:hypothetical protein
MSAYTCDDRKLIDFSDVTIDYFRPIFDRYPDLVFTNIDAKGKRMPRTVWIHPNDRPRLGNVFIEVWQHKDRFDFVLKKSIMSEEEIEEAAKRGKKSTTAYRGTISRCLTYREELLDYLIPKLDMIEAAK